MENTLKLSFNSKILVKYIWYFGKKGITYRADIIMITFIWHLYLSDIGNIPLFKGQITLITDDCFCLKLKIQNIT